MSDPRPLYAPYGDDPPEMTEEEWDAVEHKARTADEIRRAHGWPRDTVVVPEVYELTEEVARRRKALGLP